MNTDFTVLFGNIGNFISDVLKSSITSNVVAILSMIVGVIGLWVTFRTMKSAEDIKEEMKKMQIDTLEKSRFMQNKPQIIKNLQVHRNSITEAGTLSKALCIKIISLLTEIEGYKETFKENDFREIETIHKEMKKLATWSGIYGEIHICQCIELLGKLENIINKGEYSV